LDALRVLVHDIELHGLVFVILHFRPFLVLNQATSSR
jgi:hypothetical protein